MNKAQLPKIKLNMGDKVWSIDHKDSLINEYCPTCGHHSSERQKQYVVKEQTITNITVSFSSNYPADVVYSTGFYNFRAPDINKTVFTVKKTAQAMAEQKQKTYMASIKKQKPGLPMLNLPEKY